MQAFIQEVKRRKVFNTFVPYLGIVWLLLQVISVLVPMLNLSPLVNTFTVVILFGGIPIMLYISWYFNITSNGLEPIPDAESGEINAFGWSKWLVFAIITLISAYIGISYFYSVKVEHAKANEGSVQQIVASSIAVVPFTDASAEQSQAYLSQGLAEEITRMLGRANRLQVIDSRSVNSLLAQGLDPVSIALAVKADAVLTGTMRRTGNRVRLRLELINAEDGQILWSESYTREFSDIFALENDIARAALNSLIDDFISADELLNPSLTNNIEAFEMYLRGREAYQLFTIEGLKDARKYFEQSIAIAPDFTKAYVALAETLLLSADRSQNFDILDADIAKTLAQNYLAKALVQSQDYADTFVAQGKVFALDGQLDKALAAFDKAIDINESFASAYFEKFKVLTELNRAVEAQEALSEGLLLHPESSMRSKLQGPLQAPAN